MTQLTDYRLGVVLRLLSLDYVLPFYEMMGLVLPDKQHFQSVVRQALVDLRNRQGNEAKPTPYGEWLLARLKRELGPEAYLAFFDWADLTFEDVPADHPHTNIWHDVLRRAAHNEAQRRSIELPVDKADSLLAQFRAATQAREVIDLHRKKKGEELSDWDADMFARHQFEFDDPEYLDPFDWIVNTANLHRFQNALANLVVQLTDAEVEALRDSVQRVAVEDEINVADDLMNPRGLREPAQQRDDEV